jgi:hypothetical protein
LTPEQEHFQKTREMIDRCLIAMVKKAGGVVVIPIADINDATGFTVQIQADPQGAAVVTAFKAQDTIIIPR